MNQRFVQLRRFLGIEFNPAGHTEKIFSAFGALVGIYLVLQVSHVWVGREGIPLVVASMGASAVLLFAVPHGALSQPWPLVCSHLVSALVGVTCKKWISDEWLAGAVAVAVSIGAMHYLRCIHPPGGATALSAVLGGPSIHGLGYGFVVMPVLVNVLILLVAAVVVNAFLPWRRYPASLAPRKDHKPERSVNASQDGIARADLEFALKELGTFMDVSEEDLAEIYQLAIHHARGTHLNPSQIRLGQCYSNGAAGEDFSVRLIVDEARGRASDRDLVIYKVITGKNRRGTATCTREAFAVWAKHEVERPRQEWGIRREKKTGQPAEAV